MLNKFHFSAPRTYKRARAAVQKVENDFYQSSASLKQLEQAIAKAEYYQKRFIVRFCLARDARASAF